jgi:hypothetical protein
LNAGFEGALAGYPGFCDARRPVHARAAVENDQVGSFAGREAAAFAFLSTGVRRPGSVGPQPVAVWK